MYSKILLNTILILSLVIIQLSFISGLPAGLNNLNLILVILIFILALINLDLAVWWTMGIGVLLDMFSFAPFGVYLVCLSLTIIITNFLLINFFTDRSIYSFFALAGLATVVYGILLAGAGYLLQLIGGGELGLILNKNFWLAQLSRLCLNLLATLVIFYFVSFIGKRLKPVFLVKHTK